MTMERSLSGEIHEGSNKGGYVLAIECLKGSSKADEWNGNMLQTGDIVEELKIGNVLSVRPPFKNGKHGVQKLLHTSFKKRETLIKVRVRRGRYEVVELQACIVPNEAAGRKQYMLRSIDDPNYAVGFADRTESDCLAFQGSRRSRVVSALSKAQLQDGYVSYRWERKMQLLTVPNSSCFLSILFLPKASDRVASRYNDIEDTLARANAWLNASHANGVPISFMNIQTESLLTKISGETASATVNAGSFSDLSNLANVSLYGFEDYHGVDIGVVRAVRLWYAPIGGEFALEIDLKEGDTKLGFAISRTEEGFIYISSVVDDENNELASTRSGLRDLYREAMSASKFLVISRVSNQKVLPWMVSSTGAIRCFDTVSLSQKLSLHRHALRPIFIHVFMWDCTLASENDGIGKFKASSPPALPPPSEVRLSWRPSNERQVLPLPTEVQLSQPPTESHIQGNGPEIMGDRDTAGELGKRRDSDRGIQGKSRSNLQRTFSGMRRLAFPVEWLCNKYGQTPRFPQVTKSQALFELDAPQVTFLLDFYGLQIENVETNVVEGNVAELRVAQLRKQLAIFLGS
ncbi:uncharacterized protein LOC122643825 [Telopea speciosissima]|uniref:uncharacterized protein LOC122643825 n=1 Tax=Telopea speciosissima TaxID=54955 RepID=UPI001CC43E03|nr:uncharacterized protein LOC122643825 [Telopea speciosissima]